MRNINSDFTLILYLYMITLYSMHRLEQIKISLYFHEELSTVENLMSSDLK